MTPNDAEHSVLYYNIQSQIEFFAASCNSLCKNCAQTTHGVLHALSSSETEKLDFGERPDRRQESLPSPLEHLAGRSECFLSAGSGASQELWGGAREGRAGSTRTMRVGGKNGAYSS